jgi:hypothetical protein
MGCVYSKDYVIPQIGEPTGPAIDPLTTSGNIIEAITLDPHIHFYEQKIR